ncbi:hypothetical protein RRG08_009784 [Elysia crispata]|uniref:Uncharacterized protein n=1 Tax=Elysia crispata TaxID=231223 RepID=A0AAE1DKI4_9GAST|nr:hypothetical protein RRG08_009784 [Elysia crispata]
MVAPQFCGADSDGQSITGSLHATCRTARIHHGGDKTTSKTSSGEIYKARRENRQTVYVMYIILRALSWEQGDLEFNPRLNLLVTGSGLLSVDQEESSNWMFIFSGFEEFEPVSMNDCVPKFESRYCH